MGVGDRDPQIFGGGIVWVAKYHYSLSCTGTGSICSKALTFQEK